MCVWTLCKRCALACSRAVPTPAPALLCWPFEVPFGRGFRVPHWPVEAQKHKIVLFYRHIARACAGTGSRGRRPEFCLGVASGLLERYPGAMGSAPRLRTPGANPPSAMPNGPAPKQRFPGQKWGVRRWGEAEIPMPGPPPLCEPGSLYLWLELETKGGSSFRMVGPVGGANKNRDQKTDPPSAMADPG